MKNLKKSVSFGPLGRKINISIICSKEVKIKQIYQEE
jgi:hypothetical protein